MEPRKQLRPALVLIAFALSACAPLPPLTVPAEDLRPVAPGSMLRSFAIDPSVEDRILAIDPDHVTDGDVRDALAKGPTPRIFEVHGGIYPVHLLMESFSPFLVGMVGFGHVGRRFARGPGAGHGEPGQQAGVRLRPAHLERCNQQ